MTGRTGNGHETHFAPLLRMQGELHGVALEPAVADDTALLAVGVPARERGR